jgi:hypothetical protein
MKNPSLTGRAAVFAVALGSLAVATACDGPAQAITAEAVGPGLLSGAVVTAETWLSGTLAALAVAMSEIPQGPPERIDAGAPQAAPDPDEPDPNQLYIQDIMTGGPGCRHPDRITTVISEDKKSFLLLYDDMELRNPPGPKVKSLNCAAGVKLHVPNGWQVALATVNTRGYLYLDKKVRARQTSNYFFAGKPLGAYAHTDFSGPYDDFYEFTDEVPFESLVWSNCGTSVIFGINTTLNLNAVANPKGEAIFSTNTTDGMFQTLLLWQFRKC